MENFTRVTLSDSQKKELKEVIGEDYVIGQQLGNAGSHTVAYELTNTKNGEKEVLLMPHSKTKMTQLELFKYMEHQHKADKWRDYCAEGYDQTKGCFLPATKIYALPDGVCRIIPYAGCDLSEKVFSKLPQVERQSIAQKLAAWLNFVHQKSFVDPNPINEEFSRYRVGDISSSDNWGDFSDGTPFSQKVMETFGPYMAPLQQKEVKALITAYQKRDKSDEVCVLTHGDLRFQNILYNADKKQLSVIDFEMASLTSVYRDFCPFCHSGLTPEMVVQIVSAYNQLPKAHPIHIDPQKVKSFLLVAYLHELTRCATPETAKKSWSIFKKYYQSINAAFSKESKGVSPQKIMVDKHIKDSSNN